MAKALVRVGRRETLKQDIPGAVTGRVSGKGKSPHIEEVPKPGTVGPKHTAHSSGGPMPPGIMERPKTAPSVKSTAAEAKAEAAAPPTAPVVPLKMLDGIHKAGQPVEAAFIKLNQAVRAALGEIKGHGDRAAHLVQLYAKIRTAQDILAVQIKDLSEVCGLLESSAIPEAFEREQVQTLSTRDGDRLTVVQKLYASILAAKREEAQKWLRSHGHGALITETVNASALSAFAKAELAEGRELPEDIFTVFLKPSVSLTRAKK